MVKRKTKKTTTYTCPEHHGKALFIVGFALLLAAGMMYIGYGWMEIFGVLGFLAIIKGLYLKKM